MQQRTGFKTNVNVLLNEKNGLQSFIIRKHFDSIIKAVQDLAGNMYHQNEQKIYVCTLSLIFGVKSCTQFSNDCRYQKRQC